MVERTRRTYERIAELGGDGSFHRDLRSIVLEFENCGYSWCFGDFRELMPADSQRSIMLSFGLQSCCCSQPVEGHIWYICHQASG